MPPLVHHSRRQTILNAATSWADMICQGVMGLLLVPLFVARLGKDGFGLICLLNVIVIYSSFADLGIRGALGRDLSAFAAQGDKRGFSTLLITAAMLLMAIAGMLTCGFYVFRAPLAHALQVPADLMPQAINLIPAYCGGMVIVGFLAPVFTSAISAINRFDLVNTIRAAIALAGNLAILAYLPSGRDAMAWWCGLVLATQAVILLVTFCAFLHYCRPLLSLVRITSFAPLSSLMHFGGKVFALTFAGMAGTQTDPLIISAHMGPAAVATYNPATRISAMIRPMVMVLAQTLYPITTLHHTTNDADRMRTVLLKGTRYTMLLGALATVGVISLAKPFCALWLGSAMGGDATNVAGLLVILALIDLLEYAAGTQWPVLLGQRQIDFLFRTQIPSALVNIGLSIFLVGYTPLGVAGVLVATLLVSAIRRPLIIWHAASQCDVSLRTYLGFSYAPAAVVITGLAIVAAALHAFVPTSSWLWIAIHSAFLATAWIPLTIAFGLTPDDRGGFGHAACGLFRRMTSFVGGT